MVDGKSVDVQWIKAFIRGVQDYILVNQIPISIIFMTGNPIIGINFLKRYKICFDGPNNQTVLELDT